MGKIDFYAERFFDLVDLGALPPHGTLEGASGLKSDLGPYLTNLIDACETAWRTPFRDLTCVQVSTLLEQKMGLEWLGRPAIAFAVRYPFASIQYFAGEMAVHCLRAANDLSRVAQPEFEKWLKSNFAWIDRVRDWPPAFREEVKALLAAARETVLSQ